MNKINITSNSRDINTLIYLNKTAVKKIFASFVSFNSFYFNENEEFFKDIITYVAQQNFLFIEENDIS